MLLEKYSPKTFKQFIGNKVKIMEIMNWLNNFPDSTYNSCLISPKRNFKFSKIGGTNNRIYDPLTKRYI